MNQRIAVRCYLDALNRADTFSYIRTQIGRAGVKAEQIFPESALQAVYHATGGVPRLINQICDHALVLAFADGLREITAEVVEQAWADLQQIPLPWNPTPASTSSKGVIEFGSLQDEATDQGLFSIEQGSNGEAERTSRFGFLEKPELPPSVAPHLDDTALSSGFESAAEDEAHGIEAVSVENGRAAPNAAERPSGEPALGDRPDPVTQIDQIEQAIQAVQEEIPPCAVKRPQAELIFYDWGDPFEETFMRQIPLTCDGAPQGYTDFEDDVPADEGTADCVTPPPQNPAAECVPLAPSFDNGGGQWGQTPSQRDRNPHDADQCRKEPAGDSFPALGSEPTEEPPRDSSEGDDFPNSNDPPDPETPPSPRDAKMAHPLPQCEPEGNQEAGNSIAFRFPINRGHNGCNGEKPHAHRAIMKSLFTRLGRSG